MLEHLARALKVIGVVFMLGAALSMAAQTAPTMGPRLDPQAPPIYSRNGVIVVRSSQSKASYRMPVLTFASQYCDQLQRALKLKLGTQMCPLEIVIGSQSDGDTRVIGRRLREVDGSLRERIELPDPEAADLALLQRVLGRALLRAWMVEVGGREGTMCDLPLWLIDGVLRCCNREARQLDVDRTLLLWSCACLPGGRELLGFASLAATREEAVAAVVASWFLERRESVMLFETLLRRAAAGQAWQDDQVARLLTGSAEPERIDAWVDSKMQVESRVVITPGVTTAGCVRRFRRTLLLYPEFFGINYGLNRTWCTFQEATRQSDSVAIRLSARSQMARVRMAAIGRDGTLVAVAEAYAQFLEALSTRAKPGEVAQKLLQAEALRGELERRTAAGEVLRAVSGE